MRETLISNGTKSNISLSINIEMDKKKIFAGRQ